LPVVISTPYSRTCEPTRSRTRSPSADSALTPRGSQRDVRSGSVSTPNTTSAGALNAYESLMTTGIDGPFR
jgi:hypothetical protein